MSQRLSGEQLDSVTFEHERLRNAYLMARLGIAETTEFHEAISKLRIGILLEENPAMNPGVIAEAEFDSKAGEVFAEIDGYGLHGVGPSYLAVEKGAYIKPGGMIILAAEKGIGAQVSVRKQCRTISLSPRRTSSRKVNRPVGKVDY
jgi:hypothetical protein